MRRTIVWTLILSPLLMSLVYQACHISYLKSELEIRKKISVHEIKTLMENGIPPVQLIDDKAVTFTSFSPGTTYLDEVQGFEDNDVLSRIDLLQDHLHLQLERPSSEWVKSVTDAAEAEIIQLRRRLHSVQN